MLPRDLQRILKIRDYCLFIQHDMQALGDTRDAFFANRTTQQSIAFSLLQIGELASGLSEEYRNATRSQMQWQPIRGLRNIIVHDYGKVQLEEIWKIVTDDIPSLKAFCNEQLPPEYRQEK